MPDDLYSRDALAWAEQQAGLLARLAQGERVNEAVDWARVVEEVRDVGLSELRAVRSLLLNVLEHLMKLHGFPGHESGPHWRHEVRIFLVQANASFTASMRQKIDVPEIYGNLRLVFAQDALDGVPPPRLPPVECPYVLEDFLLRPGQPTDVDGLVRRMGN